MEAANAFNLDILNSPLFKLTLADEQQTGCNDIENTFYIQRELLASLSPELRKHIDNEMKEGIKGEMALHDVDRDTLQRFLQWAYVKEYTTDSRSEHTSALLLHSKLYVLADRFNIGPLKDLSFQKLTSSLTEKSNPDPSLSADVLRSAMYAVENLPALTERLVDYLLRYIAWILDNVRDLEDFTQLFQAHPDAAVALVRLTQRAAQPPWSKSSAGKKPASFPQIMQRLCDRCGENGYIAWIYCAECCRWRGISSWDGPNRKKCDNISCGAYGFLKFYCGANGGEYNCVPW
ncbi:hypothetical protein BDZ91DRAFT_737403 [Kalaharituber pfeilii]|nr:hypothetical protein BDZ91DRAFT_737403 [Kalaharituber pfeilii]